MRSRHTAPSALLALVATVGLATAPTLAAPARADDPSPAAPASAQPVVGSVRSSTFTMDDAGADAVVTLHAVRRVGDLTVVYFSGGLLPSAPKGAILANFLGDRAVTGGTVLETVTSEAMVVDRASGRAWTPLVKDGDGCVVCSDRDNPAMAIGTPIGSVVTEYVALPALPADVKTVEVYVAGRLFEDVPVEDGALQPTLRQTQEQDVPLGTAWPLVDTAARATASDPDRYSTATITTTVQQGAVTERTVPRATDYDLSAEVLFAKDSATLRPQGLAAIKALAPKLAQVTGTLSVIGYTDNLGTHEHGLDLSKRRAAAVAAALKPLLPAGVALDVKGMAEANPVASNDTEAGRQQNRRVTISKER